jgi:hypothetical protein
MFHSTGHRFANVGKSVRVGTATGPPPDSVVDEDLALCDDRTTGFRFWPSNATSALVR